jgi:hypothetical protein
MKFSIYFEDFIDLYKVAFFFPDFLKMQVHASKAKECNGATFRFTVIA